MRALLGTLAKKLRDSVNTTSVKRVIVGRNDHPMESDLPQIQVYPEETRIELSGTAKDVQTRAVKIRAIANSKITLNQTTGINTVSSMLSLISLFEAQKANGAFSTASILGVLRNDPTVNGKELYTDNMSVNYGSLDDLGFSNVSAELTCVFKSRDLRK